MGSSGAGGGGECWAVGEVLGFFAAIAVEYWDYPWMRKAAKG
jgi:hypothetical protein